MSKKNLGFQKTSGFEPTTKVQQYLDSPITLSKDMKVHVVLSVLDKRGVRVWGPEDDISLSKKTFVSKKFGQTYVLDFSKAYFLRGMYMLMYDINCKFPITFTDKVASDLGVLVEAGIDVKPETDYFVSNTNAMKTLFAALGQSTNLNWLIIIGCLVGGLILGYVMAYYGLTSHTTPPPVTNSTTTITTAIRNWFG